MSRSCWPCCSARDSPRGWPRIDLGAFSTVVALGIATVKMLLVALFFMHVRHSSKLTKLIVVGGLLWLGILLALTMSDFLSRGILGVAGK